MFKSRTIEPKTESTLRAELHHVIWAQRNLLEKCRESLAKSTPLIVRMLQPFSEEGGEYTRPLAVKVVSMSACEGKILLLFLHTYRYEGELSYVLKRDTKTWVALEDLTLSMDDADLEGGDDFEDDDYED
jgi:hypothetical protein